jgi:hypothetical protein
MSYVQSLKKLSVCVGNSHIKTKKEKNVIDKTLKVIGVLVL